MARAWAERRENLEKALKENCDSTGTGEEEAAGNHQESNRLDEPRTIITEIKNRLVPCGQYPRSRSHRAAQTGQLPQRLPPRRCVSGEAWIEAMQER